MRSTLSPSFTSSKMKQMFLLMSECGEMFANYYLNNPNETNKVHIQDCVTRYTNDMIASTAFGVKCDSLNYRNNEFYLMGKKATNFAGGWNALKLMIALIQPKVATVKKNISTFINFRLTLFS